MTQPATQMMGTKNVQQQRRGQTRDLIWVFSFFVLVSIDETKPFFDSSEQPGHGADAFPPESVSK